MTPRLYLTPLKSGNNISGFRKGSKSLDTTPLGFLTEAIERHKF